MQNREAFEKYDDDMSQVSMGTYLRQGFAKLHVREPVRLPEPVSIRAP